MVHGGGQGTQDSSRKDVIGHSESMGVKKDFALGKPIIQRCVSFKLPEGKGSTVVDVKMDGVAVVIVHMPVAGNPDAIHVLGEFFCQLECHLPS